MRRVMWDSRPRSVERFFSPPIARYRAWIWKSTVRVRLVLCLLLLVWLEMHKLQFNLSRIFKNIYEVTVFVINWAWLRCEAASYFLTKYAATHDTASLARWFDSRIFLMTLLCIRLIPFAKWQFFNFLTLWLQKIYKIVWLVKDENIGW